MTAGGCTSADRASAAIVANVPTVVRCAGEKPDSTMATGVVAGFPTVDFEATLLDGSAHEKDSSTLAFELSAAAAFREAAARAKPVMLEPVMAVEVITPTDHLGDVIGDLHRRRGNVRGQFQRGNASVVDAQVPLKEMFGYIGHLRAMTSGRAQYTMQLDHYDVAPASARAEMAAV